MSLDGFGTSSQCLTFFENEDPDIVGGETQDSDFDFRLVGGSQTQASVFSRTQVIWLLYYLVLLFVIMYFHKDIPIPLYTLS